MMDKKLILSLIAYLIFASFSYSQSITSFDYLTDKMAHIIADNVAVSDDVISNYLELIDDDGAFSDLDYSDQDLVVWNPSYHYVRLSSMAASFINQNSRFYNNEAIYNKIISGLSYWYHKNLICDNWWFNIINEPQKIGEILIQMRSSEKKIHNDLETSLIERMKLKGGNPADYTGANRTDVALHWIYRGLLSEDRDLMKESISFIYEPLKYNDEEGFQVDNSFFQHGNQLYLGGYLELLLVGVLRTAACMKGTEYGLPVDKLAVLTKYMRETFTDIIRGQSMNYNCIGRNLSRKDRLRRPEMYGSFYKRMMELDPDNYEEYHKTYKRIVGAENSDYNIEPRHTYYYRGDYTTHVRPTYSVSVRTSSERTVRCENGNGENLKGYYLSDGCMTITRTGDEYYNIMPLWDWNAIPGTTTPSYDSFPVWKPYNKGISTFCGGVSDSRYGVSTFKYYDTYQEVNTGACKSWFFFDDEVICLGYGIHSDYLCSTTIDQCWGRESFDVGFLNGTYRTYTANEDVQKGDVLWVFHNNVGYLFPDGGKIKAEIMHKEGNWNTINTGYIANAPADGDVFKLGVVHDSYPAAYTYIIVPNIELSDVSDYINNQNVDIISNEGIVQSVYHKKLDILGAVFFDAGEIKISNIRISVDKPCVIMAKGITSEDIDIFLSDPIHARTVIKVEISTYDDSLTESVSFDFSDLSPEFAGVSKNAKMKNPKYLTDIDKLYLGLRGCDFKDGKLRVFGGGNSMFNLFTIDGEKIFSSKINMNDVIVDVPYDGLYILKGDNIEGKVILKR